MLADTAAMRRRAPGSWYAVLNALSVMAVITNAFLVAFSSAWLYDLIYAGVQYLNVTVRAPALGRSGCLAQPLTSLALV